MQGLHHVLAVTYDYKNLFYHSPILTITDRTFFRPLKWSGRHGVAEIIKMAVVKDEELFCDLEGQERPV